MVAVLRVALIAAVWIIAGASAAQGVPDAAVQAQGLVGEAGLVGALPGPGTHLGSLVGELIAFVCSLFNQVC